MAASSDPSRTSAPAATDSKSLSSSVHNVLKILNSRLGADGNIKDTKDAAYVMVMMTEAVKLVDRCMFLNVLHATQNHTVLKAVLDEGGWATLHGWLQQCRSEDSNAFLLELLELYKRLPVTVELLRQNSCAKDIKQLMKNSDHKISRLAKGIVTSWVDKVKEKSGSSSVDGNSSKHTDKSSSGHRTSHIAASNKDKSSSKQSSLSSSSSKDKSSTVRHETMTTTTSSRDDVDPSRVKTLQDSPDHVTARLNHRLSADRIHTNVAPNDDSSCSNSLSVDADSSVPEPPPVHRPKTVKILNSKMRSTGLELDTPLPPTKKKISSPSDKDKVVPSALTVKPQSSKKPVPEKKAPSHSNNVSSVGSSVVSSPPPVDTKPKIKIIPARPKPAEIYESSGFMDALGSTDMMAIARRKRKLSTGPPSKSGAVPISPDEKKQPSLCHDAMDIDDHKKNETTPSEDGIVPLSTSDKTSDDATSEKSSGTSASESTEPNANKDSVSVASEQASEDGCSKDSVVEPASKKKKVKAVSWIEESKLCSYFHFQSDENERVNVNKVKDFAENRKHEQEMERHMMQNVRRMAHDVMTEKHMWRKPFLITGLSQVVVYGCNSKEKDIQRERELGVLQVLYFSKNSIPDSALEPEPEYFELIEPRIIPLSDETGLGSEVSYDSYPSAPVMPSPSDNAQPIASLPPAIANLLSQTANPPKTLPMTSSGNPSSVKPAMIPQMSPNASQPPQQAAAANVSLPPLPVFLQMPLPAQQHIFQAMPPHIQHQMMNSLPPMLQQQLGPLLAPITNGGPPGPSPFGGPPGPMMPPDTRMNGPPNMVLGPGRPPFQQPMGPSFPRMGGRGGPGMMPQPFGGDMNARRPPLLPDVGMFPNRPPSRMMMPDGPPRQPSTGRICSHFMTGNCRYGASCRNIHPPRDGPGQSPVPPVGQDSPH